MRSTLIGRTFGVWNTMPTRRRSSSSGGAAGAVGRDPAFRQAQADLPAGLATGEALVQSVEGPQERRLARTRAADHHRDAPRRQIEADLAQGLPPAECDTESANFGSRLRQHRLCPTSLQRPVQQVRPRDQRTGQAEQDQGGTKAARQFILGLVLRGNVVDLERERPKTVPKSARQTRVRNHAREQDHGRVFRRPPNRKHDAAHDPPAPGGHQDVRHGLPAA